MFTFSLEATYTNGKLTFDTTVPLTGTYAAISKVITYPRLHQPRHF